MPVLQPLRAVSEIFIMLIHTLFSVTSVQKVGKHHGMSLICYTTKMALLVSSTLVMNPMDACGEFFFIQGCTTHIQPL